MAKTKEVILLRYPLDYSDTQVEALLACVERLKESNQHYDGFITIIIPDTSVNRLEVEIVFNPNKQHG